GPDVQGVALDPEAAIGRGRDFQLLVRVAQHFGACAQVGHALHRLAHRGPGTVGPDEAGEADLAGAGRRAEARGPGLEVDRFERFVEVQAGAGLLGHVQQGLVETAAVHRPDHFAVVSPVALQVDPAVLEMDHAPAHHDRLGHHRVVRTGLAQDRAATLGQRQVDRTSALITVASRIAARLVDVDLPAPAGE